MEREFRENVVFNECKLYYVRLGVVKVGVLKVRGEGDYVRVLIYDNENRNSNIYV